MGRFHNIWGPGQHGPASACDLCGAIVYTAEEMASHRCPGDALNPPDEKKNGSPTYNVAEPVKERPEFPWWQMMSLLLLLLLTGALFWYLK